MAFNPEQVMQYFSLNASLLSVAKQMSLVRTHGLEVQAYRTACAEAQEESLIWGVSSARSNDTTYMPKARLLPHP